MDEFEKLQMKVKELESKVSQLQEQQRQSEQFTDNFSGRQVINHEVTFKQAVYQADGATKVIN